MNESPSSADSGLPVVLVVDDTPSNLALISGILKDGYRVRIANSGSAALSVAESQPRPDLILLDVMMPDLDGYEVCRRLKAKVATHDIPVIFLTSMTSEEDEQRGLELGAVDYIAKPISPPILLARVRNHLALKSAADFLKDKNGYLENIVERRTQEVRAIQEVTIFALASLAETRDNDTGNHIKRTQEYIRILAEALARDEKYALSLPEYSIRMLHRSAPLHDIGKVGIPDRILLKAGRLEPDEFEIMKTHTTLGKKALESAERALGRQVEFLSMAKEIAEFHHEKWDGSGYPTGLRGEAIPLSARLMAVADVYDALISKRVYKPSMRHEEAVAIIVEGSGKHFDPALVEVFLEVQDSFQEIARKNSDSLEAAF